MNKKESMITIIKIIAVFFVLIGFSSCEDEQRQVQFSPQEL